LTEANLNNHQNFSRVKTFGLTQGIYNKLTRSLLPNTARTTEQSSVNFINEERINSQLESNNTQGASSNIANRRPSSQNFNDPIDRGRQSTTQSNITNNSRSNTSPSSHLRNRTLRLIRMFDTDGDGIVSDREVYNYVISRKNANQGLSEKIKSVNSNANMIIRLINSVDPNRDGNIDDQELINAILELRENSKNDIPQSVIDLVAESNTNREQIFNAINIIDLDKTGKISDIEILKALINENLLGVEKDILYKILSTNKNFDSIKEFLSSIEISGDGALSNREVFNFLMAFRSKGFSISKADVLEFLKENPKLAEIEKSIEYFDPNQDGYISVEEYLQGLLKIESGKETVNHQTVFEIIKDNPKYQAINSIFSAIDSNNDGQYSTLELVHAWQKFKQGNLESETETFYTILNELSGSNKLSTLLNQIDTDADGNIDNKELIDLIIKTRSNINFKIDAETKAAIFSLNESSEIIEAAVNAIDKDGDGIISTKEVVEAIISIRKKELAIDQLTLNHILSYNPNIAEIEELMNFIDQDKDGVFSGVEIFDSIMKVRQGSYTIPNQTLFDDLIALSSSREEVLNILHNYDPDKNGHITTDDYINAQIRIIKGTLKELPEDIRTRIESLVPKSSIINQLISEIDRNSDGKHSILELVQSWQKFKQGNIDISEDIFYKIFNGLSGNTKLSSLLNQIDLNSDGNIDNIELIDLIMTIRSDRNFSIDDETKEAIFSLNPSSEFVEAAVNAIDKDGDGIISTKEVVEAIISIRKKELAIDQLTLNHILSYNPNIVEIEELMNFIDQDKDGVFSGVEIFDSIMKVRQGSYNITNQALFDDLIALSSSLEEVLTILHNYDPDKNGQVSTDDYINAQIKIAKGTLQELPEDIRTRIESLVPKSSIINQLISEIDSNSDGNHSVLELVQSWQKFKQGNIDISEDIFYKIFNGLSGNTQLSSLLNQIDLNSDGNIDNIELIDLIMTIRSDRNFSIDDETKEAIFSLNPSSGFVEAAVNAIDKDGDGIISTKEVVETIISIRKKELEVDNITLNHILSYNPNIEEIEELMNFIDQDQDGVFSAIEVFNTFITVRQGNYVISNENLFNELVAISESKDEVNRALNLYDPDKNGFISNEDYIKAQIGIRKKVFAEIPSELRPGVDSLVAKSDLINELISLMDTDADGVITDLELVKNYHKSFIINGVINLERKEMLDEILAITNPNAQQLINIREKFDLDNSGTISDEEVIIGLLKVNKGEIINLGKEAFIALLHDNTNVAEIFDTIKVLDRNNNGSIDNYEAMLSVISESTTGQAPSQLTKDILSMNSEYNAMRAQIASFNIDWSQSSSDLDNQLRSIILEIRKNNIQGNYLDLMLALSGKSKLLEEKVMNELFDVNIDGVLTDLELVQGLERHFKNQLNITNEVLINILFKFPKYKKAYDLIKAEMDAGRTIDYEDIISRIN
jgi:Ca2+-binding EF-hand superfamily protein